VIDFFRGDIDETLAVGPEVEPRDRANVTAVVVTDRIAILKDGEIRGICRDRKSHQQNELETKFHSEKI